jgi:hypothetical protein
MPSTPFHPFRKNPPAAALPAWVIDELDHPKLPEVHFTRTHAEYVLPFIDASGLSLDEICQRMQRPGGKTFITPKLLEETLIDDSPETWILCRLFKALDVPWEGYRIYEEEQSALRDKAIKAKLSAQDLLNRYRRAGPCLHALQTPESWFATVGFADPYHLTRQLKTGGKTGFHPPTAEEMATVIATQPETCAHPHAQDLHLIGGYLYHRLPDELHIYNLQGRIIASGDLTLPLPGHLMLTKPRRVHVSIPKIQRPPIPTHRTKSRRPS